MNTEEWLETLIAFDTTSRNSNLPMIEYMQDYFKQHALICRVTKDPDEPKANLFATLPAHDGSLKGGLMLSGHTDVVPVDGQQWETNPFQAIKKGDAIYGRGTCDMKGFIAVTLALLPELQKLKLPYPIHFAYSYDEEIGCRGAPHLINDILAAGIVPSACIVGEPTDMKPIVGHKGLHAFHCKVHGKAIHSSLTPQGCNAIEYSAKIISFIRSLANKFRKEGPFNTHYDVPFTTITTNLIAGGIALNTVPEYCEFKFEFRYLPEVDPEAIQKEIANFIKQEVLPEMKREFVDSHVDLKPLVSPPSFAIEEDAVITKLVREVTGETEIRKVAYATEAGQFNAAKIPSIVCGPGNIAQAHGPNEFVLIEQLRQCEKFLRGIIQKWKV